MTSARGEQGIHGGDLRRAAARLVAAYGSAVLATCVAMLRDRAAAEDVAQEVFSEAFRALPSFRGESSPRTWLLAIARNRCIDQLRAQKRDPWGGAHDEGADPDAHPDQGAFDAEWFADRSVLLRALEALAEGDRALIVLRFQSGLEYDELASAFGLREGTVRMRVSRALSRMRELLAHEGVFEASAAGAPPPLESAPSQPPLARSTRSLPARARATPLGRAESGLIPPPAPASWWSRLGAWSGRAPGSEASAASAPASCQPFGALGIALNALVPALLPDALASKLARLVDELPSAE